ncbi:MAG: hypothetical protein OEZ34_10350 [Spirochaetia bacterium]|nr:hypothetical protein [Spirochaetia bacterium]
MYEYINYYQNKEDHLKNDKRLFVLERFFQKYKILHPEDLYMWLWEGEFGYGDRENINTLDQLTDSIRKSRIETGSKKLPVWDYLGLNNKLIKINIVSYADHNCPLLRLLFFSERTKDVKSDSLRFKKNWQFIKTQISPGMDITVEEMIAFENQIPFHMTPQMNYTDDFLSQFGSTYLIVPGSLFFSTYPEYDPENRGSGDFI